MKETPVNNTPAAPKAAPSKVTVSSAPVVHAETAVTVGFSKSQEGKFSAAEMQPSSWNILSVDDATIAAKHVGTGRIFKGTRKEFNEHLRGE